MFESFICRVLKRNGMFIGVFFFTTHGDPFGLNDLSELTFLVIDYKSFDFEVILCILFISNVNNE